MTDDSHYHPVPFEYYYPKLAKWMKRIFKSGGRIRIHQPYVE